MSGGQNGYGEMCLFEAVIAFWPDLIVLHNRPHLNVIVLCFPFRFTAKTRGRRIWIYLAYRSLKLGTKEASIS